MPEEYDPENFPASRRVPPNQVCLVLCEENGKELERTVLVSSGTQSVRFYYNKYIEFHKMIRKYLNF